MGFEMPPKISLLSLPKCEPVEMCQENGFKNIIFISDETDFGEGGFYLLTRRFPHLKAELGRIPISQGSKMVWCDS